MDRVRGNECANKTAAADSKYETNEYHKLHGLEFGGKADTRKSMKPKM